jgi:2-succinyl-5-enolpyruvyl-6-hydroxy-3-cyclohexene-1-carboxylate synthase
VAPDRFEQLYGTPHGLDLASLAAAYGVVAQTVGTPEQLAQALGEAMAAGGVQVVVVRTDRAANLEVHRRLNAAVAAALSPHT